MPFDSKYKSFLINIRDSIRGKSGEIFNTAPKAQKKNPPGSKSNPLYCVALLERKTSVAVTLHFDALTAERKTVVSGIGIHILQY